MALSRFRVFSALAAIVCIAWFAPAAPAADLKVPKGTVVKLRLLEPMSSATAKLGDPVNLEVVEDVKVEGILIIPKGSKAKGFVAEAMSGQMWGAARLGICVGSVFTRTGLLLPVFGGRS